MAELAELLAPGQRIFVAGSSNEPTALLEAMAQMQLPEDLHFFAISNRRFKWGGLYHLE
ncbi:MAG: hypothetical protein CM15mP120_16840 [Pseudomonadota bacterium]|nr:MAG: hypothetical protein CM15mP120_16840 [Pseudomonadota bacterium]